MVHRLKRKSGPEESFRELSLLILDEAAFIDKIDEIWTSSQQTLTTGGSCMHFQHLMV